MKATIDELQATYTATHEEAWSLVKSYPLGSQDVPCGLRHFSRMWMTFPQTPDASNSPRWYQDRIRRMRAVITEAKAEKASN
jgi:hypothetical protein